MKHPSAVTACNLDLENLVTDSNRSIATLAITTLLKTGSEGSIDRLMKQISSFMSEISDEFKVHSPRLPRPRSEPGRGFWGAGGAEGWQRCTRHCVRLLSSEARSLQASLLSSSLFLVRLPCAGQSLEKGEQSSGQTSSALVELACWGGEVDSQQGGDTVISHTSAGRRPHRVGVPGGAAPGRYLGRRRRKGRSKCVGNKRKGLKCQVGGFAASGAMKSEQVVARPWEAWGLVIKSCGFKEAAKAFSVAFSKLLFSNNSQKVVKKYTENSRAPLPQLPRPPAPAGPQDSVSTGTGSSLLTGYTCVCVCVCVCVCACV